ncbi:MAG TPA: hypothetical protein VG324_10730, partial [Blastocatellia bacterium]|nr:hypothetical protein [Blastocatellia bacterium]
MKTWERFTVKNHRLAKSINDAGWSQFVLILTSKAEEAGRVVIAIKGRAGLSGMVSVRESRE